MKLKRMIFLLSTVLTIILATLLAFDDSTQTAHERTPASQTKYIVGNSPELAPPIEEEPPTRKPVNSISKESRANVASDELSVDQLPKSVAEQLKRNNEKPEAFAQFTAARAVLGKYLKTEDTAKISNYTVFTSVADIYHTLAADINGTTEQQAIAGLRAYKAEVIGILDAGRRNYGLDVPLPPLTTYARRTQMERNELSMWMSIAPTLETAIKRHTMQNPQLMHALREKHSRSIHLASEE